MPGSDRKLAGSVVLTPMLTELRVDPCRQLRMHETLDHERPVTKHTSFGQGYVTWFKSILRLNTQVLSVRDDQQHQNQLPGNVCVAFPGKEVELLGGCSKPCAGAKQRMKPKAIKCIQKG